MPTIVNTGKLINFLTGITGVSPGGTATINMDLNKRYHRIVFQCKAINYTGGTGLATVKITGSGNNGLTVTPTVVNGVVTAAAVVAGGTGYTVGDTVSIIDKTGQGAVLTVSTVSSGVVTALTVSSGGTVSPINPSTMISSVRLLVNGITLRDITPANIIAILQSVSPAQTLGNTFVDLASRYDSTVAAQKFAAFADGELPIYFTEPARNKNGLGELTAWDMFGQSTFQILLGISATVSSPQLLGSYEFDYARNATPNGQPFLQPITQRQFSLPIPAGRYDVNTLPYSWPITRCWIVGSTPGSITQIEVYQDGNKVLEATTDQIQQMYGEYGFWLGTGYGANNAVAGAFDGAFISDPDQNLARALKCANSFTIRIYSSIAQTVNIIQEMSPSAYAS